MLGVTQGETEMKNLHNYMALILSAYIALIGFYLCLTTVDTVEQGVLSVSFVAAGVIAFSAAFINIENEVIA